VGVRCRARTGLKSDMHFGAFKGKATAYEGVDRQLMLFDS